ncbi:hypothetical protein [Loigolactobacillus zhaoyuanensis]|uniref:Uncharacterized protein n=1 Tax=Loigolactobacillus zhaoyuanensis TaxID=2486017 RepID=A0ABW8U948_9LACO|nr:hypothetical protein [Loigolactobacillus zhaoyuanensis]
MKKQLKLFLLGLLLVAIVIGGLLILQSKTVLNTIKPQVEIGQVYANGKPSTHGGLTYVCLLDQQHFVMYDQLDYQADNTADGQQPAELYTFGTYTKVANKYVLNVTKQQAYNYTINYASNQRAKQRIAQEIVFDHDERIPEYLANKGVHTKWPGIYLNSKRQGETRYYPEKQYKSKVKLPKSPNQLKNSLSLQPIKEN